ncbi:MULTISPECIES: glutamate--cysteine ligase [Vibrio]|uniref:glutamate--cysteine ligase n=1 Tax=Vibrio TaxID=662 RepID=UPI0013035338|nr:MULTISPECIES: glutamate--cysteine ligase [Vibrio]EGQ9231520.1 glutamate--cysteine ligase [Vibrio alginolyticus]EGR0708854.1 glutamate--cysteine ligase [Vibrio alginolyticus]ELP9498603.1 glutamate--cysteine ligase [Vibrio alginolyticus]MBT0113130.1 glutamate--cysteine ligase [Vibrio alginolyticus]MCG6334409.1 glutamate--cysteine ligase [Vibrio alginolyticus]
MTDFAARLKKVASNPEVFKQFGRGVERETLRYRQDGHLATTPHPEELGSAFTNQWITTDFSESLLEFITPVSHEIPELMAQLKDIHHFTQTKMGEEKMWPLSMPCYVGSEDDIQLAQYGSSNAAKMKTLYREGLKRRYGSLMQIISGVHFNFSFPETFWDALYGEQDEQVRQDAKSDAYFALIRNYYRFGWMIPYFFGASPALCGSFIQGRETDLPFEKIGGTLYLPKSTSLRLSDLGYTNSAQSVLKIGFNSIDQYLDGLSDAIRHPSEEFAKIGVKVDGEYRQLNSNILQIENELYAPIRPKRVSKSGEKPSDALRRGGVEYIEVRSLDVNPFSAVGLNEEQVRFLDLFLTWAALSDSDPMDNCELECWRDNWNKVIVSGREKGLMLQIGCQGERLSLQDWAHRVFVELRQIAQQMDMTAGGSAYQDVCNQLETWIDNPELTISGQLLELTKDLGGLGKVGCTLGMKYRDENLAHGYQYYSQDTMETEVASSVEKQKQAEQSDTLSFDDFLEDYFAYLKQ